MSNKAVFAYALALCEYGNLSDDVTVFTVVDAYVNLLVSVVCDSNNLFDCAVCTGDVKQCGCSAAALVDCAGLECCAAVVGSSPCVVGDICVCEFKILKRNLWPHHGACEVLVPQPGI